MMLHCLAAILLVLLTSGRLAFADDPESAPEELTAEAQAAVDELRASLPAGSEAIAMLEAILSGSQLGPGEGWFASAVSQSRFNWETLAGRFDADEDRRILPEELPGLELGDFPALDRDGDRVITEADFDWSESPMSRSPGGMLFYMTDEDGNGKVMIEEFQRLFARLDAGQLGFLSQDELRGLFQSRPGGGTGPRPDDPSRSTLILGLKNQEIGSLQPGPALGEAAPDFTLTDLDGREVTLSQEIGEQPVVLVFGNFTCGPFRSQAGNIEKLYHRYKDRAKFFLVYVREAHPSDGWWMLGNQRVGIDYSQPRTDEQRRTMAETCRQHLEIEMPFLVDTVSDRVGAAYSGMPNRLYLIDREGKIAFKSGRGPFGFHPRQLEQALILLLRDAAE